MKHIYKLKCLTHSYKCDLEKFILCLYVCDILSVNQYNYLYAKLQEFEKRLLTKFDKYYIITL